MFKRSLLITLFIAALSLGIGKAVLAENTTFKQRILPKDCIFTVLDVGTQTLFFITPKICEPPPPVNTSTALELPLEQLVTYEDPDGKTTLTPPGSDDQSRFIDIASISANDLIISLLEQAALIIGLFIIAVLWLMMVLVLTFGMPGLRKAFSIAGLKLHIH